jgi:methylated-DNA-[protein]-cysteine S-methyltransferase
MESKSFGQKVLSLCASVPRGRVTTYKLIAKRLGNPRASRAVGQALNRNNQLIKIPCHRVVMSNGGIGGYRRGSRAKVKLLQAEGVKVFKGRVEDFNKYLFKFED